MEPEEPLPLDRMWSFLARLAFSRLKSLQLHPLINRWQLRTRDLIGFSKLSTSTARRRRKSAVSSRNRNGAGTETTV